MWFFNKLARWGWLGERNFRYVTLMNAADYLVSMPDGAFDINRFRASMALCRLAQEDL